MKLKNHILKDMTRQPLITEVAKAAKVSEQSIRLWVKKDDMRLLAYPIMVVLANHYQTQIPDLFEQL